MTALDLTAAQTGHAAPALTGLSETEAAGQLEQFGPNELESTKPRSLWRIALGVLREPMFLLLISCAAIYYLLGDAKEAAILGGFVVVVICITLYQERKTERALDALRDLSSPRALVIRGGERRRIAGREVVPDDLLVLTEGDRVAADGVVLSAMGLQTDESLLTGESMPVRKAELAGPDAAPCQPGGDDLPWVYSGSLVVGGHGITRVTATGARTELGKIGKSLASLTTETTLVQRDARYLVRVISLMAVGLCLLLTVAFGMLRGNWLRGLLAGLTMAMSLLPEELPVVLIIFFALGAWRMSKLGVLTRNTAVLETLGAATVLCVDKTGTLTVNQMSVRGLDVEGVRVDTATSGTLAEPFRELAEFAVLATRPESYDPMDKALRRFGETALAGTSRMHNDWTLLREYPLTPKLFAISEVWKAPDRDAYVIGAKGAPEAIADLCHLPAPEVAAMAEHVAEMAAEGLRVLAVAKGSSRETDLPPDQHDFTFQFLGLAAFADPVRETVPAAVRECAEAGIRVVMITGDYPGTAASIARQVGLPDDVPPVTGAELAAMSEEELARRVGSVNVFARAVPEQKLRLVNALKAHGEIVAMTGDGVNDAPALKAANIGIAMGERGTDVAREAASLVLLNDDFSSIVQSVRAGRRIFDNLKKAMAYIFAVHVPIAGLSLAPVFFGWPLILGPVHIAFLELIIDPACSVAFEAEPEEPGIMQRPPRKIGERLFNRRMVTLSLLQGVGVLLILLAIYAVALYRGDGETDARTLAFATLVIANLALIFTNRSWEQSLWQVLRAPNPTMWGIVAGAVAFLGAALYIPFLRSLFQFSFLHPGDVVLCLCAGLSSVAWFEALKFLSRKHRAPLPGGSI